MELHHAPSASFLCVQIYYSCSPIAQLLFAAIQYRMLLSDASSYGLRAMIGDVISTVVKLRHSVRHRPPSYSESNGEPDWLVRAYDDHDVWRHFALGRILRAGSRQSPRPH